MRTIDDTEKAIQAIKKLLYWDYDKDRWKTPGEDPMWRGLDELCEIDSILKDHGLGPCACTASKVCSSCCVEKLFT